MQIDELLKVDLPPDALVHVHVQSLNPAELRYLLITHSHRDHICASEVENLSAPYAVPDRAGGVQVFGNDESIALIRRCIGERLNDTPAFLNTIAPFVKLDLPPYTVDAIRAHHEGDRYPLNYLIERDGRSLLYACDTGHYEDATWEFLAGRKLDLMISECTEGPRDATYGTHMGLPNVVAFRRKALEIGLVENDTPWILTHFSHSGGLLHEELEDLAHPLGFTVAWDGMEITL